MFISGKKNSHFLCYTDFQQQTPIAIEKTHTMGKPSTKEKHNKGKEEDYSPTSEDPVLVEKASPTADLQKEILP